MSVRVAASAPGMPRMMISEGTPSPMPTKRLTCTLVLLAIRSLMSFAEESSISSREMTDTLAGVSLIRRRVRVADTTILSRETTVSEGVVSAAAGLLSHAVDMGFVMGDADSSAGSVVGDSSGASGV